MSMKSEALALLRKAMIEGALDQGTVLQFLHDVGEKYPVAAAAVETNDDLEVDDKPLFSRAGNGTWVSAWVWVPDGE